MAPFFEETDLGVDHNQLVMAVLRRVALRHGLQAIVHEKPFAGINGSGKHCNWSMAIGSDTSLDGLNLLKPGRTPHQNIRFLVFLAAVLKGVHDNAGLLRAGIATSGNEHRLGANEAPPAIISVFMGDMLTELIDNIIKGKAAARGAEQQLITLGVAKLPEIEKDNTDRNRTSPFAFTGNKFEFRAVGGGQSIAWPITLLHAAVASAIDTITSEIRAEKKKTKNIDDAVLKVVRKVFKETTPVRFEGNNYAEAWVKEAARRGLPNLRRAPEGLAELTTKKAHKVLVGMGVLTEAELESRYHVRIERYIKDMLIEMHTLGEMIDTLVLPAAYGYAGTLATSAAQAKAAGITEIAQVDRANEIGKLARQLKARRDALVRVRDKAEHMHEDLTKAAMLLTHEGADAMAEARASSDALEVLVADDAWPLPKYREMLFPV
jgi:glutamine synthetase